MQSTVCKKQSFFTKEYNSIAGIQAIDFVLSYHLEKRPMKTHTENTGQQGSPIKM